MRTQRVEKRSDTGLLDAVGLDAETVEKIYRLLALARLEERFVLPTKPVVQEEEIYARQGCCGFGEAL
jgi:nitrate reductase beta subunit